jgi:hypothetical protein
VEKAVVALVIEGILNGYWQLANPEDMDSETIEKYIEEKRQQRSLDPEYVNGVIAASSSQSAADDDGV